MPIQHFSDTEDFIIFNQVIAWPSISSFWAILSRMCFRSLSFQKGPLSAHFSDKRIHITVYSGDAEECKAESMPASYPAVNWQ